MLLQRRLLKGTALNLVAMSFNQGSTLIASIIVARILKKEAYGEYAIIYTTLITAVALSQLAMGYTASKYVAEYRAKDPGRAGSILGACAMMSLIMAAAGTVIFAAISPWLASSVLRAPAITWPLMVGSGFLFFSAFNGYQSGALIGLEGFSGLAKAGVISGVLSIVIVSLGALWGGLTGAVAGLGLSAFVRCGLHNVWLRQECSLQRIEIVFKGSLSLEKGIIRGFALPAALAGYYSMPMVWLANSFLVRQPGGFGEMALYSAANSIRLLVLFIPNVINGAALAVLNNEMAKGDLPHYRRLFRSNVKYIGLVTLAGVAVAGLLGRPILGLFGKEFTAGYTLLLVLLLSCIFESLSIALFQYLNSQGRIWRSLFFINFPREALLVILAFTLVRSDGAMGLAAAYLSSAILGLVLHIILVAKLYKSAPGTQVYFVSHE